MRSIEIGKPTAASQKQVQRQEDRGSTAGRLMRALQDQGAAAGPWGLQPATFSFGVGANFELDTNELSLQTRLKFQDWFTLKVRLVRWARSARGGRVQGRAGEWWRLWMAGLGCTRTWLPAIRF